MRRSLRALVAAVLVVAGVAAAADGKRAGNVVLDPLLAKSAPAELTAWIAYGVRISNYLNETGRAVDLKGPYEPSFEVEVEARTFQARVWREMTEKKRQHSVYLDDIVRVDDAGYIREYVWRYYGRPAWGEPPVGLRLPEFQQWARDHLAAHVPYTGARVEFPKD